MRALLVLCWSVAGLRGRGVRAGAGRRRAELEQRVTALAAELRCLVCQNQSIAESNADLARRPAQQIREQMQRARATREIRDYMVARYGDFVLYRPPLKASTVLLWVGPFALLGLGALIAARIVRTRRSSVALSDADRARAAELLGRGREDGA